MNISVRITEENYAQLHRHLFPGDGDEHGAVLGVGVVDTDRGKRLLVRKVFKAKDGVDYMPGDRGYRKLTARFVAECLTYCEEEGLGYVAVHCHGGRGKVGFSNTDMESHERGYPALLSNLSGMPVGGLVFAVDAVAGDIWLDYDERYELEGLTVVGNSPLELSDGYTLSSGELNPVFDRQIRMLGESGQRLLKKQKVAVIGAGGVGAIVVEQLARMGVGEIVVIDDDRVEITNLNRLVGSTPTDVTPLLYKIFPVLNRLWPVRSRLKVDIAKRHAANFGSDSNIIAVAQSVTDSTAAAYLKDCDYIFLAADTAQARLVYNSVVHQYLVSGVQMGVKIQTDNVTGDVVDIDAWVRRSNPGEGCLWCNALISPGKLQQESLSIEQKRQQQYVVNEEGVHAPSIIMLNGIVASHAVDGYIERLIGLSRASELKWLWYKPLDEEWVDVIPASRDGCTECDAEGKRFALGDATTLPVRGSN